MPEMEQQEKWILCPVCGNKTRNKIRADTVLKYFPLFCPKCKKESLIEVEELKIKIISEPSTKMQSQYQTQPSLSLLFGNQEGDSKGC